jgi:uncharacterized protein (DUF433 family)
MYNSFITTDPDVMMGKPVVRGTRITVEHILEELSYGATVDELLEAHPRLTREAILAALAYALDVLRTMKAAS